MRSAPLLLVALLGGCSFPDVLTDDALDASSGGPSGPGPGGTTTSDAASSGGPGSTSTTGAGGGGATASSSSDTTSTSSAQGGAGGDGGAPGSGGAGGEGEGGQGPTTSTATATTTAGSGGSGPCPDGCDACGGACPADAIVGDCDGDGDPDGTDCQMCDDRVFDGQPAYFTTPYPRLQGGTSFDYDCSGSNTTDYNEGACSGLVCPNVPRFYSEPPACGQPATSVSCKAVAIVGCTTDQTFNDPVGCH